MSIGGYIITPFSFNTDSVSYVHVINKERRTHMNTTTYPRAEQLAKTMQLPLTSCQVTKELYGYSKPVLDTELARCILFRAGLLSQEAVEHVLIILNERVSYL